MAGRMFQRGYGLIGTWSPWRKWGLIIAMIIPVALCVVLNLPFSFGFLMALFIAARMWHHLGSEPDHPNLGQHIYDTYSYKAEAFFTSLWMNRMRLISPVVMLFGPPDENKYKGLTPSLFPVTRLSSYWALALGLALGFLDFFLAPAHYPVWGRDVFLIPPWVMYGLSVVFWFILFQCVFAVRRWQGENGNQVGDSEPKPAVMLNLVSNRTIIKGAIWGFGAGLVMFVILLTARASISIMTIVSLTVFLLVFLIAGSRLATTEFRAEWRERMDRRSHWMTVWDQVAKPALIPQYVDEIDLPTVEEHEESETVRKMRYDRLTRRNPDAEHPPFESAPYEPEAHVAMFSMAPGATFMDYVGYADRLPNLLDASSAAIVPVGEVVEEADGSVREVEGTIGPSLFRLWWPVRDMPSDFLADELGDRERELLIHAKVMATLSKITGIGYCTLLSHAMLTKPGSLARMMELRVVPANPKVEVGAFMHNIQAIQNNLGVEWVRAIHVRDVPQNVRGKKQAAAHKVDSIESRTFILLIGDTPVRGKRDGVEQMQLKGSPIRTEQTKMMIDAVEWATYFTNSGITDTMTGAPPKYLSREAATSAVDKLVFEIPPTLSYGHLSNEKSLANLKGNSGYEFLEVSQGGNMPDMSEEERILNESKYRPGFTMVAARQDPLKRPFPFGEYTDRILKEPTKYKAQLDWTPGIFSDDSLAIYKRGADAPHLLVAGESGGGKSVLISSMLAQLLHNNDLVDLECWMIEPKTELQVWQNLRNVTRFVDSWTPNKDFYGNVAILFQDAVQEMERRNEIMAQHFKNTGKQVRDIDAARKLALKESIANGTPPEDHPLWMPFIYIIVEECASLFGPVPADDKEYQKIYMAAASELARKARSAGILMTFITQYPTNESIPSIIRQQCARIGLKTRNGLASRVIIDENGLEDIKIKGVGMMRDGDDFRRFRSLWVRDGDPDEGEQNDVLDIIQNLPQHGSHRVASSGGETIVEQIVPTKIADSVFSVWDKRFGFQLEEAIIEERETRDIPTNTEFSDVAAFLSR